MKTPKQPDYRQHLIQKTLFQTVSRNLVRQLHAQGCSFKDLVDFANEILEEIVSIGTSNRAVAGERPEQVHGLRQPEDGPELGSVDALQTQGRVNLTEDMYVRRLTHTDIAAISAWQEEEAVAASLAGRALGRIVRNPGEIIDQKSAALFVMCRAADDQVIGLFGFPHIESETRQAQCIKMIGEPSERGKHYARLATRFLIGYGFNALHLNRIYLYTLDGNLKNISLNQSLGFSFEGLLRQAVRVDDRLRDVAVMALVKDVT